MNSLFTLHRAPLAPRGARELSHEDVEAIAHRVAELITPQSAGPAVLIGAGEVARRFGVSRTWVYDHAALLGAIPLGDGLKPRLRFSPERVARALSSPNSGSDERPTRPTQIRSRPPAPTQSDVELLPVKARPTRGLLSRSMCARRSRR